MDRITELVLASRNKKKFEEFSTILAPLGIKVRSVLEYPDVEEVEETGTTFKENAALKAESVAAALNCAVLADDSGLQVDYLGGEPGVYSSRFSGEKATDSSNNRLLLEKLAGVAADQRGAGFVCVLALAMPGRFTQFFEGCSRGRILDIESGCGGFGYDPLFYSDDLGVSFAEAGEDDKNRVSHRGRAVEKFLAWAQAL